MRMAKEISLKHFYYYYSLHRCKVTLYVYMTDPRFSFKCHHQFLRSMQTEDDNAIVSGNTKSTTTKNLSLDFIACSIFFFEEIHWKTKYQRSEKKLIISIFVSFFHRRRRRLCRLLFLIFITLNPCKHKLEFIHMHRCSFIRYNAMTRLKAKVFYDSMPFVCVQCSGN